MERSEKIRLEQCITSRAKRSEKIRSKKADFKRRRTTHRLHMGSVRQQMIEMMAEYEVRQR